VTVDVKRLAFWGRVSTEDNQDIESSRSWQVTPAKTLIEPRGGQIVAEFFDIDKSRSIPPQRRPQAAALLAALADPNRGFDAVVVGEPQRAFYGVSKGERNRIKIRVRTAMAAQAQLEGRFLGGRPPCGYQLIDVGPHPNPAKAADGKRLHALAPDPNNADVVPRIFTDYLAGKGFKAIAEGLTREGIPSPSAYDPARNRHRCGIAWSWGAVAAILANPRYTGRQVWNRQRKDEVLLDVEDVALGFTSKQRWNEADQWIWSDRPVHEPLIDTAVFEQVRTLRRTRGSTGQRAPRSTPRPYSLRGLLYCGVCERRMQGSWNNHAAYYRCVFLSQYAAKNKVDHPRAVYLREDQILPSLDHWPGRVFHPDALAHTVRKLEEAQQAVTVDPAQEQARREIADCDAKLRQHRAALQAGADPKIITSWMAETQIRRTAAEIRLQPGAPRQRLTREQLTSLVTAMRDLSSVLTADAADRAEIYGQLGLALTYLPEARKVNVEARPSTAIYVRKCPRGGLERENQCDLPGSGKSCN
jgi:site-specific DNA recombinase